MACVLRSRRTAESSGEGQERESAAANHPGKLSGSVLHRTLSRVLTGSLFTPRLMRSLHRRSLAVSVLALFSACAAPAPSPSAERSLIGDDHGRLPTGARLDPAAPLMPVGQMPLAMVMSPERTHLVMLLNGWGENGVQIVDRRSGAITQTVTLPAAFLGLAFSPDGHTIAASGGNTDRLYLLDWNAGTARLRDSIVLHAKAKRTDDGVRYPSGLAYSRDGRLIYAAENLADSLAVVDATSGAVLQRLPTGHYPYGVAVAPNGRVFVSNWGGDRVSEYTADASGRLQATGSILVGRHPSALLMNTAGNRLFVASASTDRVLSVDIGRRRVVGELLDPPPAGPAEGSTPNALALSDDGTRLFVAEADANAVAVFDLTASTSGVRSATGDDRLVGRVPAGWYPTAVLSDGAQLIVANGKGGGTRANPDGPNPAGSRERRQSPGRNTTLSQLTGALMVADVARADVASLASLNARVSRANGWDAAVEGARRYPPIEHVIYIIKENRTYDQILGDLTQADGDTSLVLFGRPVTPNMHALAERFGIFDRFFVNAEVSPDGHNWSMAAYTTDYLQKTVPLNYSGRGRSYDYEGASYGKSTSLPEDDVAAPARGYLWNLAQQKGISFRNYGEFVMPDSTDPDDVLPAGYRGNKPFLTAHTNAAFPGYNLAIPDQRRADVYIAELARFTQQGRMPALEIVRLPNDHTAGATAGRPTPRAYVADNDLALGRIVEAISHSPFWERTAIFVLEDDAQNGPDHVDSHRSPMVVISPWVRAGVVHRFANTTDVLRTIEELLGLEAMSQFDHYGRPLRDIWSSTPDTRSYSALLPSVALTERNPAGTRGARESRRLQLGMEDMADEDLFNQILWRSVRPGVPYPGARRGATLEALR